MDTTYSYNVLNQLTQVTMTRGGATQTRTFNYDVNTGRLMSATNPENGTVSYTYNPNGTLATRTDAKNQQIVYTYDNYNRVTQIQRNLPPQYQGGPYVEDVCQRATYYYDLNPFDAYFSAHGWGRLVAVRWGGGSCAVPYLFTQMHGYTPGGLPASKRLQVNGVNLDVMYGYNNEGKMISVQYPINYTLNASGGVDWNPGPVYTYSLDPLGRAIGLTDNQSPSGAGSAACNMGRPMK